MPINFRLIGAEIRYIVENAEAGALIVQDDLLDAVEEIREDASRSPPDSFIHFGDQRLPGRLPRL